VGYYLSASGLCAFVKRSQEFGVLLKADIDNKNCYLSARSDVLPINPFVQVQRRFEVREASWNAPVLRRFQKRRRAAALHDANASFHATQKREAPQSVQFPMVSTEQRDARVPPCIPFLQLRRGGFVGLRRTRTRRWTNIWTG
jgi:hypothetical protein